jgi:two-component sensor histidine kinase
MLAALRRILERLRGRPSAPPSIRSRLLIALAIAAAPGVLFAAFEAQRQFQQATRAVAAERTARTQQLGAEVDGVMQGALQLLEGLTGVTPVRDAGSACSEVLRGALSAARYTALVRLDVSGMPVCASSPAPQVLRSVEGEAWFEALHEGAPAAVSPALLGQYSERRILILGRPVVRDGAFAGALTVGIDTEWLNTFLANIAPPGRGGVFILDSRNALVAGAVRRAVPETLQAAVQEAAGAADHDAGRRLLERHGYSAVSLPLRADGLRLFVLQPRAEQAIGWRASLIVISPLMVCALSLIAVWLSLQHWVLRWHAWLGDAARAFGAGRPLPQLEGMPPREIKGHFLAFADAVDRVAAREVELAAAVESNLKLSRELHHRVKNNLQILSSLASRQQRRMQDSGARRALSESRAYLLAISLIYRFLEGPEELGAIDLRAYLSELSRQLHLLLLRERFGEDLHLDLAQATATADEVGSIGLIVADCFIAGSRSSSAQPLSALVRWRGASLETPWALEVEISGARLPGAVDGEMIQQLARQLKAGEVEFGPQGLRLGSAAAAPSPVVTQA